MRRVLFVGQKPFGEEAWDILRTKDGNGYRVVAVCSNASADKVWWRSNRIFEACGNIPFIDNSEKNEELLEQAILRYRVDTILCVQHSWIFSSRILKAVNYQALNFHNAKLPEYKGYNAVNHAILNGDPTFTCTAHWIADEVDAGALALEATFDIAEYDTAISLYAKSHCAGLRLFSEIVARLGEMETIPCRKMSGAECFYPRNSIVALREIKDPSSVESEVKARAFFFPPFEPAFFRSKERKVYVLPASLLEWGFNTETVTLGAMITSIVNNFACEVS